jgi:hypothetical protein
VVGDGGEDGLSSRIDGEEESQNENNDYGRSLEDDDI